LIYGGFTRSKALLFNFATALTAVIGTVLVLIIDVRTDQITKLLVPFAAGGFIYIATADLIPEIHKHTETKKSIWQVTVFFLGIGIMASLLLFE
jgi:zinc and cadmium transporter